MDDILLILLVIFIIAGVLFFEQLFFSKLVGPISKIVSLWEEYKVFKAVTKRQMYLDMLLKLPVCLGGFISFRMTGKIQRHVVVAVLGLICFFPLMFILNNSGMDQGVVGDISYKFSYPFYSYVPRAFNLGHIISLAGFFLFLVLTLAEKKDDVSIFVIVKKTILMSLCALAFIAAIDSNNLLSIIALVEIGTVFLVLSQLPKKSHDVSVEIVMKSWVMLGLSFSFGVFGVILIVIGARSFFFDDITTVLMSQVHGVNFELVVMGLIFFMVGLFIKMGIFPFGLWLTDLTEGSSLSNSFFVKVVMRSALMFILIRIVESFAKLSDFWFAVFCFLGVVNVIFCSLLSLTQNSLRRTVSYCSSALFGQIFLLYVVINDGLRGGDTKTIFADMTFLLVSYVIILFGLYVGMMAYEKKYMKSADLFEVYGLAHEEPKIGGYLLVFFWALAGLPFTVGFASKMFIFVSLIGQIFYLPLIVILFGTAISIQLACMIVAKLYSPNRYIEKAVSIYQMDYVLRGSAMAALLAVVLCGTALANPLWETLWLLF